MIKRCVAIIMAVFIMVGAAIRPGIAYAADGRMERQEIRNAWDDESYGDFRYRVVADNTIEITGCISAETELKIPKKIHGKTVTTIGEGAFKNCYYLEKVSIPESVTTICNEAFSGCGSLVSVNIPMGVTMICVYTFSGCSSLKSVSIPSSVTEIGECAFAGCNSLSSINIPPNVTDIYRWAFSGCNSLKNVSIPISVKRIGSQAFSGCDSVTDVYYAGSEEEWETLSYYPILTNATIHYNLKNAEDSKTEEPTTPDIPSDPDIPSQSTEAAAFSLPGMATNILTGNEVKLSGSMQLTDVSTDMENLVDTEISGITWNSSNEDIISASDIKCIKASENDLSASCKLSITMPAKKCGEVTITGTTRNGISASTKVEVFPKMTLSGHRVDAGENIYRNVCTVTLDNPDKSFLEQFMPKLQLDVYHYNLDELGYFSCSVRLKETKYEISSDGKYAMIEAVFESVGIGSESYAVKYRGCSEILKTFSVQSNLHSWSDVRDKELSKMNEDQNGAYSEIQNAIGDFRDKFQEFIDSLHTDAEKKGGNALESSNKDLAKKLEEECGAEIDLTAPVFEDQKRGETRKKFIYTELSKKLASIANEKMGSIKVSDQDKAPKNIVDNVIRGYHPIGGTVQSEDKKMELSFDIIGMYNVYAGCMYFTEAGVISKQKILVNMTQQHLENALQQYAKDLAQLQSDAGDAIYSAMAKDLLGKSISDFAGDKFVKLFSKYEPQLEKWGVKGVLDFAANCYTVYEKASAIDADKIVNNTDIGGIVAELEKVKGLLDVELKGFTNTSAKKAGKKVVKAAEYLYKICKDYTEDGKITNKYSIPGFVKYVISCPVEVFVYDAGGNQIGYAGEDDLDYDSSIMIEEVGEAKVIYIPVGTEASYKINGTGYGELNCSFEEYDQDGMAVGRLNYYNIDLTPESKIEAAVPSNGFVSNNSNLPITVDGAAKAPDACLESKDYEFVDIQVAADDPDGGIFRGAGKYVPGDAVNLVAVPNSGYIFAGWYDDGGNFVSMNRNIEFAARNSGNYTAKFLKLQGTGNAAVKSVKLSKTSYEYNGKSRKPSVIAVDTDRKRISSKYYTVKYKNNKKVGKATATIKFKDGYEGTVKKAFTIRPSKASIQKLTAASRGFTVKWGKKTTQTDGYQIQYSTGKKFTKSKAVTRMVKNASIDSIGVKKLEPGKRYYVRIRTYKTVNGKKYHSVWSKIKGVATKK